MNRPPIVNRVKILFVYIALVCLGALAFLWWSLGEIDMSSVHFAVIFAPIALVNSLLAAAFLVPLFVGRRPWMYGYCKALLLFSCMAFYAIPFNFLCFFAWRKPEVKEYFQ